MDALDQKILSILQENASLPIAEIAARVGLSQTPCWKRIQKLEAAGVITRRVALLSPEKLGLGLCVYVSIAAGEHSEAWLDRFTQQVAKMPEVVEFHRMAGDIDYMLRVVVVSRFAMERIKATTALPFPDQVEQAARKSRIAEAAAI